MSWLLKGAILAFKERVGKSKKNVLIAVNLSKYAAKDSRIVKTNVKAKVKEIKINLSNLIIKMSTTGKNKEIKRMLLRVKQNTILGNSVA